MRDLNTMWVDIRTQSEAFTMSEPIDHTPAGDPHGHAAAESPFSDAQWDFLQAEDYSAGRAVVILMLGIFSIGVILYGVVAFSVWTRMGFSVFN
jgi:hypothetical protein